MDNKAGLGFTWGVELACGAPRHLPEYRWRSRPPGDAEVPRGGVRARASAGREAGLAQPRRALSCVGERGEPPALITAGS